MTISSLKWLLAKIQECLVHTFSMAGSDWGIFSKADNFLGMVSLCGGMGRSKGGIKEIYELDFRHTDY